MSRAEAWSALACLQGHTAPHTEQNPPTLVCAWRGGSIAATGARPGAGERLKAEDFM
jgi:hypothetical protein